MQKRILKNTILEITPVIMGCWQAGKALAALHPIATEYNTTLAKLALAWVMSQANTCAIVGARTATQAIENAQAMQLSLSPDTKKNYERTR